MLVKQTVGTFLEELSSPSPAPGGGTVAALSGALGSALTSMVCNLTIGKKKYAEHEEELKKILNASVVLQKQFTKLIDDDTQAFNKVMEAYGLPKENEDQKALRSAVIQEATKEAALVPLEVMKHVIDALALTKVVAEKGNQNSISDSGVSALMLQSAAECAALNVRINLQSIKDSDFVNWKQEEVGSLLRTVANTVQEVMKTVNRKMEHRNQ